LTSILPTDKFPRHFLSSRVYGHLAGKVKKDALSQASGVWGTEPGAFLAMVPGLECHDGHQRSSLATLDSSIHADSKENGEIWLENSSLREAAFGNPTDAKQEAEQGLKLYPASQGLR
jgi:hypothetical protein